jgi:hypothetical protein
MGFDLYAVRARPGADDDEVEALVSEVTQREVGDGEADPVVDAQRQEIAAALREVNPALEPFAFDHAEIARSMEIGEDDARRRFRHVELNAPPHPAHGVPIQIALFDDWASLSMPYGGTSDTDESEMWALLLRYLDVFVSRGYTIFDPQGPNILDVDAERAALTERRAGAAARAAAPPAPARRPWWKLW